jgi:hypothetical protein
MFHSVGETGAAWTGVCRKVFCRVSFIISLHQRVARLSTRGKAAWVFVFLMLVVLALGVKWARRPEPGSRMTVGLRLVDPSRVVTPNVCWIGSDCLTPSGPLGQRSLPSRRLDEFTGRTGRRRLVVSVLVAPRGRFPLSSLASLCAK